MKLSRNEVKEIYTKVVGRGECDLCGMRRKRFEYRDRGSHVKWCFDCISYDLEIRSRAVDGMDQKKYRF